MSQLMKRIERLANQIQSPCIATIPEILPEITKEEWLHLFSTGSEFSMEDIACVIAARTKGQP